MKKIEKKFIKIFEQMYPNHAALYPYNTKYSKRIVKFLKDNDEQLSTYELYNKLQKCCRCSNISATTTIDGKHTKTNSILYETVYEQNNEFSEELVKVILKHSEINYKNTQLFLIYRLNEIPIHKYLNLECRQLLLLFKNMYSTTQGF